ncbi:hypothetical protein TUM4644_29700 [Shewanella colwelliana]|uniref:PTS sugar transporter subunit IIA n=1 Tax=Shewanella colwelliana TaxID=23 RepID=A0A1E5INW6_SHECO|nr:DUF3389 family protein [Shewanella colwelliana]MDX1280206.1 DUF3389 family protein [Shewanella colwelliana]OEG72232.1 PTS sugar transporter subunit IIA [Shewanella colwelliana]GIU30589.1 hypothetical protein TUM4644_29700 [Shewanella colwelliana]GIU34778.1 hypothetical protein TUM3794_01590 [Shewanella colwelliana]
MVLDFTQGKLILSPFELQIKLTALPVTLYAMAEDIKLISDALMIVADAGAVRWHCKLDSLTQMEVVATELGLDL